MKIKLEYCYNKNDKHDKIILVNVKNFNSYDINSYNYIHQGNFLKKEKYYTRIIKGRFFGIHLS